MDGYLNAGIDVSVQELDYASILKKTRRLV